jgi:hypothetical protein
MLPVKPENKNKNDESNELAKWREFLNVVYVFSTGDAAARLLG